MNQRLTIRIDEDGASSFVSVVGSILRLLSAIDRDLSGDRTPSFTWHIESASKSNPIQLVLAGQLRSCRDGVDPLPAMIDGLNRLEQQAIKPLHFSMEAMDAARSLVAHKTPIELSVNGSSVRPTTNVLAHVDTVLLRTQAYSADTAIDGRLDAVYVHGEQPQFLVFDPITDKGVKCFFPETAVEEVISLLTNRVRVFGLAKFNRRDEITQMQVESFERLPEKDEVPTLEKLHAAKLDITGGIDAADYIRRLRDGE